MATKLQPHLNQSEAAVEAAEAVQLKIKYYNPMRKMKTSNLRLFEVAEVEAAQLHQLEVAAKPMVPFRVHLKDSHN